MKAKRHTLLLSPTAIWASPGRFEPLTSKSEGPKAAPKAVPSGSFKTWATAHRWVERARAWDNRQQRVADKAIEKVVAADATARTREQIRDERRLRHEELEYIAGANLWRQAIASLAAMPAWCLRCQVCGCRDGFGQQTGSVEPADAGGGGGTIYRRTSTAFSM